MTTTQQKTYLNQSNETDDVYIAPGTQKCNEHQAIEVKGKDGKTHQFWARSAKEAFQDATKWSYRHQGLHDVYLLVLRDENELQVIAYDTAYNRSETTIIFKVDQ